MAASSPSPARVTYDPSFSLEQADWIGFDVDCTLVRYRLPLLTEMVYDLLAEYLVTQKGYPAALRGLHAGCVQKGVVFEHTTGHHLKLDAEGRVAVAWHGCHRRLTAAELEAEYGAAPWWAFPTLQARKRHDSFTEFLSYFDLPGIPLTARLVDLADHAAGGSGAPYSFVPDVFEAFNHLFDWTNFGARTGGYFPALEAAPGRYLEPRPGLRRWLEALRARGQRLFLCTNSQLDYAALTMEWTFGADWRSLFDVILVNTVKPSFFTSVQPFVEVDVSPDRQVRQGDPVAALRLSQGILAGGNAAALQALADTLKARGSAATEVSLDEAGHVTSNVPQKLKFEVVAPGGPEAEAHNRERVHDIAMGMIDGLDQEGGEHVVASGSPLAPGAARMVYVGDHLHGDVAAVRPLKGWAAIAVVEELETDHPPEVAQIQRLPNAGDLQSSSVGHTAVAATSWGDFFEVEGRPTWYARLIQDSAVLAVSDLRVLAVP
eukprot:EG_transcript_10515